MRTAARGRPTKQVFPGTWLLSVALRGSSVIRLEPQTTPELRGASMEQCSICLEGLSATAAPRLGFHAVVLGADGRKPYDDDASCIELAQIRREGRRRLGDPSSALRPRLTPRAGMSESRVVRRFHASSRIRCGTLRAVEAAAPPKKRERPSKRKAGRSRRVSGKQERQVAQPQTVPRPRVRRRSTPTARRRSSARRARE